MEHYEKRKKLLIDKMERKIFEKICKLRFEAQKAQLKMERNPKWHAIQNGPQFKMERNPK